MKWMSSGVPGVRYREHPERTVRGGAPDRYFSIRFFRQGRDIEEGLGWASEGWTVRKASDLRDRLKVAHKTGEGPDTLAAKRGELRQEEKAQEQNDAPTTYQGLAEKHYLPWAKREKKSGWLDEIRLKNHLYPAFGDMPLEAITTQAIEVFRDRLLETLSRSTAKQILALLRKTLNHFAQLGLFALRNPVSNVKMPRLDNACERFLSREDYARLVGAAGKMRTTDLRDAIVLAVHTGLRLGEIHRLDAVDVDLAHGYLTVREDDGKPGGKVPLNDDVRAMLTRRLAGRSSGLVIAPTDQLAKTLSRQFTRLAKELGLNTGEEDRQHRLTFHSLRHTFASWLALADVDLYRIQKLMRHKTPAMTQRYAHLRPSALLQDVAILCSPPSHPDPDDA
jgi:integrase